MFHVALSTRSRTYLTPPMAVRPPKPMSMWKVSPKADGRGTGVVDRRRFSIVAVSPRLIVGSRSVLTSLIVGFAMIGRIFWRSSMPQKPMHWRNSSGVRRMMAGSEEDG